MTMESKPDINWEENNQVKTDNAKIIKRQEWDEVIMHRSFFGFWSRILVVELVLLMLVMTLLGLLYLLGLNLGAGIFIAPTTFVMILLALINAVIVLIVYRRTVNSYYRLTPNLYKDQSGVLISIPGTVERKRGALFSRYDIYPINEFERVSYRQNMLERLFNSGTIVLNRQQTGQVALRDVIDPVKHTAEIQKMIADISGMNPQQQYLINPS